MTQPTSEQETAELAALKHDIERHVEICSQQAEEIGRLRALLQPFADAARALNNRGRIVIIGPDDLHCDLDMEDLARAAELLASPE